MPAAVDAFETVLAAPVLARGDALAPCFDGEVDVIGMQDPRPAVVGAFFLRHADEFEERF